MDLTTTYLGIELPHPIFPGSSPFAVELDKVKLLQDAGAPMISMHSLFEEQITGEILGNMYHIEAHTQAFAEAQTYLPEPEDYRLGPVEYLEQIRRVKEATGLPVAGSLNGITPSGWLEHAKSIQQAGADALELNFYYVATDLNETGSKVESRVVEIVKTVKQAITIPVAVKLSPYFSSMAGLARQLDEAGADGLILFNRFYQPDLDINELEVVPRLQLSTSAELLLRVQWTAILSGRVRPSLAVAGGVHHVIDTIKVLMAGAHAVQVVSCLLAKGPSHLAVLRDGLSAWLEEHEYESLKQLQGSMSLERSPSPQAFQRGNYLKVLSSWRF